jgi:hypothetical protein
MDKVNAFRPEKWVRVTPSDKRVDIILSVIDDCRIDEGTSKAALRRIALRIAEALDGTH